MRMPLVLDVEIRSTTELQKRTKHVLDTASERPVVIRREQKDDIALVNHTWARRMFASYELAKLLVGAARYVVARLDRPDDQPTRIAYPLELEWAREFDNDDLVVFLAELQDAYDRVVGGDRPASVVTDVVEQWHRSAMVLRDGELRERLERERSILLEG
jgi:hypothetical protein